MDACVQRRQSKRFGRSVGGRDLLKMGFSALGVGQENTLSSKVKKSQMANLHSGAAPTEE